MENASKALMIAAEVLIGVLLLSLMATIIYAFTNYQAQIEENYKSKEINEFNIRFLVYQGKDLTAQDVVTIYNMAQDYNSKFEGEEPITIWLDNSKINMTQLEFLKEDFNYMPITGNKAGEQVKYKIKTDNGIMINQTTGKIETIYINKVD